MNKSILSLSALAILVLSCQSVEQDVSENGMTAPEIIASVETQSATKSMISVDELGEGTIYWTPADQINIFYGTVSTLYTSRNTENATTAVFRTTDIIGSTESASTNIWGLYPYDEEATCDGTTVTTTLPATQFGVPETFDDDLFITLAHSTTNALKFFNVCGGIKFSLSRDDITSITFRGNNDEDIAGDISLTFENGLPKATVVNGLKEITLTPKTGKTFSKDLNYYLIVLPEVLSNGFTMTFSTKYGYFGVFCYSEKAITIKRSVFSTKAAIDTYATFAEAPADQPNNVIYYTSLDGKVVMPYASTVFGANIVSNEYKNGQGVITFDGDVTTFGDRAFYKCVNLTRIALPQSVTSIGDLAFSECTSLSIINIPSDVTTIGTYAFQTCSDLTSVVIPQSVTSLGYGAFRECFGLETISIYGNITSIASATFFFCNNLTTVILPESVTMIGDSAFTECSSLSSISIPNNVTTIGSQAFAGCSSLTSVRIPEKVETLGESAFGGCSSLETASICGSSMTSIGKRVFYDCSSLKSINIPSSVSSIGSYAFEGCTSLTSICLPENVSTIEFGAFSNCSSLESIIIPEGLASIGESTFSRCSSLTSINIPESITSIGGYAFYMCSSLSSINIPKGLTNIGESAFYMCSGLTSINIPDSIASIGGYAFYMCSSLSSINIPKRITSIGLGAFQQCSSLTSITVRALEPPSGRAFMFNNTNNCPIFVPAESVEAYQTAEHWRSYADRIQALPTPGYINGHAYVEMGDGLKWATMNLGADSEADFGDYFAWGETEPYYIGIDYTSSQPLIGWKEGKESGYSWGSYQFNPGKEGTYFSKYTGSDYNSLQSIDDAAAVNWGGSWRMPTITEWAALRDPDNFTWTREQIDGKNGFIVESKINGYEGNKIFLPASGYIDGDSLVSSIHYRNSNLYYWSSTWGWETYDARLLKFIKSNGTLSTDSSFRYWGQSIRPVSE